MDEIPNLSEEEVEQYLTRDIDDLYIMVSHNVPMIVDGRLIQQTPEQALVRGREIFERVKEKLRQKICVEWNYCTRKKEKKFKYGNELFNAVLALVASVTLATKLAVLGLTLLLFKIGLNTFCNCKD